MTLRIAISMGDVTGVGPEVALKALAGGAWEKDISFVLIGDAESTFALKKDLRLDLPIGTGRSSRVEMLQVPGVSLPRDLAQGAPEAARAAVAWVRAGAEGCLKHEFDALVTAPVNKESIIRAGIPFVGQTEMLSE